MIELEFQSIILGGMGTLFLAFLGRLFWKYAEPRLSGRANVIWFGTHDSEYTLPNSIDDFLWEMHRAAVKQDENSTNREKFVETKGVLRQALERSSIVVHNFGRAPSDELSVLVSKDPLLVRVSPEISIHKKATADGKFEFSFGPLGPSSQIEFMFVGLNKYHVRRVVYGGIEAKEYSNSDLVPTRFIEQKRDAKYHSLMNMFSILMFAIFLFGLLTGTFSTSDTKDTEASRTGEISDPAGPK